MPNIEKLQRRATFLAGEAATADQTVADLDQRVQQLTAELAAVKAARKAAVTQARAARAASEEAAVDVRAINNPSDPVPGAPVSVVAGAATGTGVARA